MMRLSLPERRALGLRAARSQVFRQDKVWSRYSNDKVDIAHRLAHVLRVLSRSLPLARPLRALSIGSSNEPQFRILESACRGGLYLLDIEAEALAVVRERIRRQHTDHVRTIRGDYRSLLGDERRARRFRARALDGHRMALVSCITRSTTAPNRLGGRCSPVSIAPCWRAAAPAGRARRSMPC